jgi:hypothetical protein
MCDHGQYMEMLAIGAIYIWDRRASRVLWTEDLTGKFGHAIIVQELP